MIAPDGATIALRLAIYVDLMLAFGLAAFGLYALTGAERVSRSALPLKGLLLGTILLGLLLSIASLFLLAASMSGQPVSAVDRETIGLVLSTTTGTAFQIRLIALVLAGYVTWRRWRDPVRSLAMCASLVAVALATLAWAGHGTMGEGRVGWIHLTADIVHLVAAGVWIGAIFALLLLLWRRTARVTADHLLLTQRSLSSFSVVGSIAVGLIIITGVVNSWVLIGFENIGDLFTTTYGLLLSAKLILFAGMLTLAALNRFQLTPALGAGIEEGRHAEAVGKLRMSLAAEAGLAVGVLSLVAWLGLLSPVG